MPVPQGTTAQALTDAAKDSLLDLAVEYVTGGLEDFAFAALDYPAFLADTSPIVTAGQPARQIGRAMCRQYARGGGPQNLPGFDAAWSGICGPYLDSIGESPTPGGIAPQFTGGQCAGVSYVLTYQYNSVLANGQLIEPPEVRTATITGPILAVRGAGSPEFQRIEVVRGNGIGTLRSGSCPQGCYKNIKVNSVVRADGQPDVCGDPPPLYDPPKIKPGLPTLPPTTPVDLPGIGPVDFGFEFSPSGAINVSLPDVGVDFTVEDPFGLGGDGGDGGGGPAVPPPGDVGAPGTPQTTGEGGEAAGEAPPGSVLVGLRVQVLTVPSNRNRYTEEVYRGAYYVYMGVPGLLDLDPAGAMVRLDQFIFAEKENLTAWRVRANSKYVIRVTPYYRSAEV